MLHSLTIRCIYPQPGGTSTGICIYIYVYIYTIFFKTPLKIAFFVSQILWICVPFESPPPFFPQCDRGYYRWTVTKARGFTEKGTVTPCTSSPKADGCHLASDFGEVRGVLQKGRSWGWSLDPQIGFSYFRFKIFKSWSFSVEIWLGMAWVGYDGVNDITYFGRNYQRVVKCMVVFECALQGA